MRVYLKNQRMQGGGLIGAMVASVIIGIALLSFQASFLTSAKSLYRLQLIRSKNNIISDLKTSGLNMQALRNTKTNSLNQIMRRCMSVQYSGGPGRGGDGGGSSRGGDGSSRGGDGGGGSSQRFSQGSRGCINNAIADVGWWDSSNKKISGSLSTGVLYDSRGEVCQGRMFGKECPFQAKSTFTFLCSGGVSSCDQAEEGIFSFSIGVHNSIKKYAGASVQGRVLVYQITEELINRTISTDIHTSSTRIRYVSRPSPPQRDDGAGGGSSGCGPGH